MKCLPIILILFYFKSNGQTSVDTLTAAAYRTNFFAPTIFGTTTNGHIYAIGFNLNYAPNGDALETDVYRIDLTAKKITTKPIPGSVSAPYMFWRAIMDTHGRVILGLNSNRDIYMFNMKDSIWIKNLGKFQTGELAYSMVFGRDSSIGIGGSSGPYSTLWGYVRDTFDFVEKPVIDEAEGYTLAVMLDTDYAVVQVGQNPYKMYAIRRSDNTKTLLASQLTLFNTSVRTTGLFYQDNTSTWHKVVAGVSSVSALTGTAIDYREVSVDFGSPPLITGSFYDPVKQKYFWNLNGVADSIPLVSTYQQTEIRRVFNNPYNYNTFPFVGDYYGFWYNHNNLTGLDTALGYIGFNTFDAIQVNDTTKYISGYPSGVLAKWITTRAWTAETFFGGQINHLSATTNPQLIGYWRSGTTAGFHEAQKLIQLSNGKIFSGGNEIRTGATTSIGGYDPATGAFWGLSRDSIYRLNFSDIAGWGKYVLFSTNNSGNIGTPKLFQYDSELRTLVDSLNFGFTDNGKIYVIGDMMLGVAPTRLYKVNLSTKQLIYSYAITTGTIGFSQMMADGILGINTASGTVTIPKEFWQTRSITNRDYIYNGNGSYYTLYNNQGLYYQILLKNGISTYTVDPNTPEGRQTILKNLYR